MREALQEKVDKRAQGCAQPGQELDCKRHPLLSEGMVGKLIQLGPKNCEQRTVVAAQDPAEAGKGKRGSSDFDKWPYHFVPGSRSHTRGRTVT